jgi:hypothetical protein
LPLHFRRHVVPSALVCCVVQLFTLQSCPQLVSSEQRSYHV